MFRSVLVLILLTALTLQRSDAAAPTSEALCADLAASIRKNPANAVMRVEDALVINEAYASAIVLTALASVDGDARMRQKILDAAVEVVPHRRREIAKALELSSVPAAVLVVEQEPEYEVRRAESANTGASMPLMEVRKAVIPQEEVRRAVVVKRKRR